MPRARRLPPGWSTRSATGSSSASASRKSPAKTEPARCPAAFAHSSLRSWLAANPPAEPGRPIGVVTIAGNIVDGEAGPGTAGGERIAKLLDKAQDKDLAALVVRVDSPGGSIFASEQIRAAIERHKARGIPVVVSMANLAASGGYWVSTPATRLFAEPATITGSIGIFAVVPSFERALADYGVTSDGVRTTPLSGQPDPFGGLTPEVSELIQANIENGYARFIGLVGKSRGKSAQQIDAVGQGRVWDGGTARQNGLIDQFGGLDDALAYAARRGRAQAGRLASAVSRQGRRSLCLAARPADGRRGQRAARRGARLGGAGRGAPACHRRRGGAQRRAHAFGRAARRPIASNVRPYRDRPTRRLPASAGWRGSPRRLASCRIADSAGPGRWSRGACPFAPVPIRARA